MTALPWLAEVGAAWATNVDLAIATALNLYFAYHYIQFNIQWLEMAKLFLSAAAMSGTAWFVYNGMLPLMGNGIATIAAILLAAIIYVICLFVFRAIALDEAMRLPVIGNIITKAVGLIVGKKDA